MSVPPGILSVLKPPGPSSQQVVRAVAAMAGRGVRAGHAGTLDPAAAGVLQVGLGSATRLLPFLQGGDKHYRFDLVLGIATDTQDAAGQVVERQDASQLSADDVAQALPTFVGRIRQQAPLHSARHVDGRRLYSYARQGEPVQAPEFEISVHALRLLDFCPGTIAVALCDLICGPGTYVRALSAAIGQHLGTVAHTGMLLRLAAGETTAAHCHTLETLEAAAGVGELHHLIQAPGDALAFLPALHLTGAEVQGVSHGIAPEPVAGAPPGMARLVAPDGDMVAVAECGPSGIRLRCVLPATTRA